MRFVTVFAINAGVAIGFMAARQLLSERAPSQVERLPEGARGPVLAARERLQRARARFAVAWNEGVAERDRSADELTQDYRRRTTLPRPENR